MGRWTPREFRRRLYGNRCVYCGERREAWDHFPPESATNCGFLLPSCHQCNCFAGTVWPYDFDNRSAYVKDKIRIYYAKALRMPNWDPSEFDELGYALKMDVQKWLNHREKGLQRIAWSAKGYLLVIDPNSVFARTLVAIAGTPGNERNAFVRHMRFLRKNGL